MEESQGQHRALGHPLVPRLGEDMGDSPMQLRFARGSGFPQALAFLGDSPLE